MTQKLADSELLETLHRSLAGLWSSDPFIDGLRVRLRATIDAPQQEAVAWRRWEPEHGGMFVYYETAAYNDCEPLYAHPAPSVPDGNALPEQMTGDLLTAFSMWRKSIEREPMAFTKREVTLLESAFKCAWWASRHALSAAPKAPSAPDDSRLLAAARAFLNCNELGNRVKLRSTPEYINLFNAVNNAPAPKAPTTDDRKDAERYRWLRSNEPTMNQVREILNDTPDGIDAAIDAAILARGNQSIVPGQSPT